MEETNEPAPQKREIPEYAFLKNRPLRQEATGSPAGTSGSIAGYRPGFRKVKFTRQLMQIIEAKQFKIVFQPVVRLPEGEIYGYEALVRLPEGSCFASPLQLFNFAAEAGLLYPLEWVTREEALRHLGLFSLKHKLFLNINPQIINDPHFIPGQTAKFVKQYNLTSENIVFEITEGMAIKDFPTFRKTLDHYRNQGYLIAIDDFGAGYSNLRAVAELQPDFIKLDMSLVRDIHKKAALQALIETLITFACKTHSQLIAEGIENEAELMKLVQLGITFGQGYLLAQPAFPPPLLKRTVAEFLQHVGITAKGFRAENTLKSTGRI